nr:probable proteasome subunit beta type-3 [Aegilops tauschii subsp. strangulata]
MYKPDMEPEELFETISQALLSSIDCDCLSGWGGYVLIVRTEGALLKMPVASAQGSLFDRIPGKQGRLSKRNCNLLLPSIRQNMM